MRINHYEDKFTAMDNSEQLINKIKGDRVKPLPRWRFTLKNTLAWVIFALAVAFGAMAFSVILYAIQQVDFDLAEHLSHSPMELVLSLMPFFWAVSLIVLLVIAIIGIRNSRKGYKFTSLSLVGISAALSILAGTLFFIGGGGNWLDRKFEANVDIYKSVQDRKVSLWSMPEEGYISGAIVSVKGDQLILEDFMGKEWKMDISDVDAVPAVSFEEGEKIKVIGKMTSEDTFKAEMIRPWGGGERMKRFRGGR